MSTPFHLLPPPGSFRLIAERPRLAVAPVLSPWPAPVASTVKRSNVWPAPIRYATEWSPPVNILSTTQETVTATPRRRRRLRRIDVRAAVGALGATAAALAIVVALIAQL